MKCAACQAQIAMDTPVCPHCGHKVEAPKNSPKKTMMGLPAVLLTGGMAPGKSGKKPAPPIDRNTLFGTPAVLDDAHRQDQESGEAGLDSDMTGPADSEFFESIEKDNSTQIAPSGLVDAALSEAFSTPSEPASLGEKPRDSHATEYGLPAVTGRQASGADAPESFSQAWGLDEESEEATRGSTQVAGASMMAAIRDSRLDLPAVEDSPAPSRAKGSPKQTMMGLHFDVSQEDLTRPIDSDRLDSIRGGAAPGAILSGEGSLSRGPLSKDSDSRSKSRDEIPVPQATTPADISVVEQSDATSRRKNLLNRLRAKTDSSLPKPVPGAALHPASRLSSPQTGTLDEDLAFVEIDKPEIQEIVEIEALDQIDELQEIDSIEALEEVQASPDPLDPWARGPRFSIPEPTRTPSAPESWADAPEEMSFDGVDEEDAAEASAFEQESFVSKSISEPEFAPSPLRGRGVFDSLDGVSVESIHAEGVESTTAPGEELSLAPPDPAEQPIAKNSKAAAIKVIQVICVLLGALGVILAVLGAVILLGVEGLGLGISATIATILLVAGCVLCVCAGLFVLALRWIS